MRVRPVPVLAVAGAFLLGSGYVLGQATAPSAFTKKQAGWVFGITEAELQTQIYAMSKEDKANAHGIDNLVRLYTQAGRDPELTGAALHYIASQQLAAQNKAESAVQAQQASGEASARLQMVQVAQNQRIIELLEKINAKR